MKANRGIVGLILVLVVGAPVWAGKVYLRWTEKELPAKEALGAGDVVVPLGGNAPELLQKAKSLGYRVYLEALLGEAERAASDAAREGAAGILLAADTAKRREAEERARGLQQTHAGLTVLIEDTDGKQPQMRGWLVFKRDGILQVSSPTSQPWLDTNLALVRYLRGAVGEARPLYTFTWDENDPLVKEQGPRAADYVLAVAEAAAFRADLVLGVHESQQKALVRGDKGSLAEWAPVKQALAFYEREDGSTEEASPRVAVLAGEYGTSYEALNLMARHNLPYRVLRSADVKVEELKKFDVVIAFAELGKDLAAGIEKFTEEGGVAVLVNLRGPYAWEAREGKVNGPSVTYTVGKGKVIQLKEAVTDPETFAQDVRRLMVSEREPVKTWNALTTLVTAYAGEKRGETVVELVNYSEEPRQVQVQMKGSFASARYESVEKGCCEAVKVSHVDGFTEFVATDLVSGGRVRLEPGATNAADKKTVRH